MPRWNDVVRGAGLVVLIGGCQTRRGDAGPADTVPVGVGTPPADSVVLRLPDGVEIALGEGRAARDAAGVTCFERTVKIRSRTGVITVPLLYTGRPPTVIDRGALRAELWKDCRPMADYRIDLGTGRPTKLADR